MKTNLTKKIDLRTFGALKRKNNKKCANSSPERKFTKEISRQCMQMAFLKLPRFPVIGASHHARQLVGSTSTLNDG
jgi:hypothetical protein